MVVLDDGELHARALMLGATATAFDGIETGTEITVQLAIVVDHADGDHVVSDILERTLNQSLTEPSFTTGFLRVAAVDDTGTPNINEFATETVPLGVMYYVGYNGNFGNYRADGLRTRPDTPRFRMGLAYSDQETDDQRSDVDFDAYIIRVEDESGDRVFPYDAATVPGNYGTRKLVAGQADDSLAANTVPFGNVRINDDGRISAAIQDRTEARVPFIRGRMYPGGAPLSPIGAKIPDPNIPGVVFAETPHEHRDFPIDLLTTDETYRITVRAENEDDGIISPVASLTRYRADITDIDDDFDTNGTGLTNTCIVEFTVLK